MLYEDDIVDAVCSHLKQMGFIIDERRTSLECGDDIIAKHLSGIELRIEAKGETSKQPNSSRYGKPFKRSQVLVHVGQAFYRAASMLQETSVKKGLRVGVALPHNAHHLERVAAIDAALRKLGVIVFWVHPDRNVTMSSQFDL